MIWLLSGRVHWLAIFPAYSLHLAPNRRTRRAMLRISKNRLNLQLGSPGSLEFHITPLLYGASQLHVHVSVIITDPLRLLRLIDEKSIQLAFDPSFLLSKLTCDLEKHIDLFGCFNLSSIKRINSRCEAIVSRTARAFVTVMKKLSKDPSTVSFMIAPGFGMTEAWRGYFKYIDVSAGGCFQRRMHIQLVLTTEPAHEFLDLRRPLGGCEMRFADPANGVALRLDGESGELQIRGSMVFVRYYNNAKATTYGFVEGGWFHTGDVGIVENGVMRLGGRIKDTIIVGVSYSIPELKGSCTRSSLLLPSALLAPSFSFLVLTTSN
ncbi:uncharacterized protein HD556DRAFT_1310607 [Suillus plorans]|uniref:AMP-dependent synthetase/ligase domain-containing protein n=1 Tax=Suillus plorans TaxID=116603 RepID=A0A9P7AKG5_9AGAM|nr:uncharacterized protein HD556DRAFT_1310607 [Suillus plorans]KAG1790390.1 hypothetical protein HD556DRAFT_1310607 [Suillus plorans]